MSKSFGVQNTYIAIAVVVIIAIAAIGVYSLIQSQQPSSNPAVSPSPTIPLSPSVSITPQPTPSPTSTVSTSPSPTPVSTPTPTQIPTVNPSPSIIISPSPSTPAPTAVPTPTPTIPPTPTPSPTPVSTPTPTLTPSPSSPPQSYTPVASQAKNWAGYVVATDLQNPQPNVIGVSASWAVPTIQPSANDGFTAVWIGIGGQFDQTLIQCGTEQDSISGQPSYSAWYELLPRYSRTIVSLTVSPGDKIEATILLTNAATNEWSVSMTDVTNGESFKNTYTYASSQLSAEWIVERPTVNNVLAPLANFTSATFTGCHVSTSASSGAINNFPSSQITMYSSSAFGASSFQLADTSSLSPDGTSFTVTYITSG